MKLESANPEQTVKLCLYTDCHAFNAKCTILQKNCIKQLDYTPSKGSQFLEV